jgi:hypothetical protein
MTAPMDYPTVVVGGRTYSLKYSLMAKYRLSRRGIDEKQLLTTFDQIINSLMAAKAAGQDRFVIPTPWWAALVDTFDACVAHMYVGSAEVAPSADQWAAALEPEFDKNPELAVELFTKLRTAILKVPRPSEAPAVAAEPAAAQPN